MKAVITVQGREYKVGGVVTSGQVHRAYLNRSQLVTEIWRDNDAFNYHTYEINDVKERYPYRAKRGAPANVPWPPPGKHLKLYFKYN